MNRALLTMAGVLAVGVLAYNAGEPARRAQRYLGMAPELVELLNMRNEPNVAAFLAMLRYAEGTSGPQGYHTLFGGGTFLELDTHPQVRFYETSDNFIRNGRLDYTTAAGAYQETFTTWRRLSSALGTSDFSPATQDAHAIELIREKGALDLVRAGRFEEAVAAVAGIWASLPGAPYGQPTRSLAQVRDVYAAHGGAFG